MNTGVYKRTLGVLHGLADLPFKEFSQRIIKSNKQMIGVKIPLLKKVANEILKNEELSYLDECEFKFFEDTLIFGLIIAKLDEEEFFKYLPTYLSHVDSWAHIDSFVPTIKFIKKNKDKFFDVIKNNLFTAKDFCLRFYLVCLMNYYLDDERLDFVLSAVESCDGKGYYNDMAIAWLLSVAFIKRQEKVLLFLKNCKLSNFTLNKTISKIRDSLRVTRETKSLLLNCIRKN